MSAAPSLQTSPQAPANPLRGEAQLCVDGQSYLLRPSFGALVAAEEELGPLFALVERAAAGQLALNEMAGLFWHCIAARPETLTKDALGKAIVAGGLANATPVLRQVLQQILAGQCGH